MWGPNGWGPIVLVNVSPADLGQRDNGNSKVFFSDGKTSGCLHCSCLWTWLLGPSADTVSRVTFPASGLSQPGIVACSCVARERPCDLTGFEMTNSFLAVSLPDLALPSHMGMRQLASRGD